MRRALASISIAAALLTTGAFDRARAAGTNCGAASPGAATCDFTISYPSQSFYDGYVSAATGSFSIRVSKANPRDPRTRRRISYKGETCELRRGLARFPGQPLPPAPGTFDASHTTYTAIGPGQAALAFTTACTYTLTIASPGSVAAGEVIESVGG